MGWIILILWIVGAITAYPRNKKWIKENIEGEWDNNKMLHSVFTCITMWYIVWTWFLFEKVDEIDWLHKKSKF